MSIPLTGLDMRLFVGIETTAGTGLRIYNAAMKSMDFMEADLGPEEARGRRSEGDRSKFRDAERADRISTVYDPIPWRIRMKVRPSGTAGTAPDCDPLLEAAFGTDTNTPGASEQYTILSTNGKALSIYIVAKDGTEAWSLYGAIVQQVKVSILQNSEPEFEFSGVAMYKNHAVQTTVTAAAGWLNEAGPSTATCGKTKYMIGSGFTFLCETEQMDLNSISYSGGTLTCARGVNLTAAAAHAQDKAMTLHVPTSTFVGRTVSEHDCTITFDNSTTDLTLMSASVTFETGLKLRAIEAGETRQTSILTGLCKTSWNASFLGKHDARQELAYNAHEQPAVLVMALQLGTVAGDLCKVNLPQCEVNRVSPAYPAGQEDELTFSAEGTGLPSSSGHDSINIMFN